MPLFNSTTCAGCCAARGLPRGYAGATTLGSRSPSLSGSLSLAILERPPRLIIRPLSVTIGRYDYRAGCAARRSAVDLPPIRHFEAIVRERPRRETATDRQRGRSAPRHSKSAGRCAMPSLEGWGDGVTDDGARHRAHTRTRRFGRLYNRNLKRQPGCPRRCEVDAMAIPTHLPMPNDCHRHRYRQPALRREPGIVGGRPAGGVCRPDRCLSRGGDGRILIHSPNVRTCTQTKRGHWMPAVSPLLAEGDEDWFRRQPYSRVHKPRTAIVSALTPHIAHEPCHRVDHPPGSHWRRVPTRTTLPTHLRSVDSSAWSFASFRSARLHPWPLDSRIPEGWVMRGAW